MLRRHVDCMLHNIEWGSAKIKKYENIDAIDSYEDGNTIVIWKISLL